MSLLFRQWRYLLELYRLAGLVSDWLDRCVIVEKNTPDIVQPLRIKPSLIAFVECFWV